MFKKKKILVVITSKWAFRLNVERMERKYKDDFKDTSEMEALQPTVYTGTFTCPMSEPLDTFLNMTGWFKVVYGFIKIVNDSMYGVS